jgi:hypothetical protein
VVSAVSNLEQPTVAELDGGTDISGDLIIDGLQIERSQETEDATPWRGPNAVTRPTRYGFSSAELIGKRSTQGGSEALWTLASYRASAVLVVRYGVPQVSAWAVGQVLETFQFAWGKRSVVASSAGAVLFRVPIHISEDHDDAVVVA